MEKPQRTITQNRALHLAFTQIATELVGQGIERKTIVDDLEGYSAPVTPEFLKEVFKTIMYTMYRKTSTTDLSTSEMTNCFDVFAHFLSENYGIDVVWPSNDQLAMQALIDQEYAQMQQTQL